MKKLSLLYSASLVALGLGFTACDQLHNDFRLEPPTSYTMETPSDINQLIIFGTDGSNVNNQWDVTTAYPYNINTSINTQVQVAKSEADFLTWENLVSDNGGDESGDYTDTDGLPYATFVNATYTSTSFTVAGADLCDAINAIYGFENADQIEAAGPVEVVYRVHIWVPNVLYSSIFSNAVTLPQVQTYIPIRDPRRLYMVGAPNNWAIEDSEVYIEETEAGSNIYSGTLTVPSGQFMFRFYSELGDWDTGSVGAGPEDDGNFDIEFTDDVYSGDVYYDIKQSAYAKVNWNYPDWEGGTVDVKIDLNNLHIDMTAHVGEVGGSDTPGPTGNALFYVGKPDWDINSAKQWLDETSEGSNIYTGVIEVAAGDFQFRFYSVLGNWDQYSVGSQNEDASVDITFTDGGYTGPVVAYDPAQDLLGKGNWQYTDWAGGYIQVTINLNDLTIEMKETEKPAEKVNIYLRGGWDSGWAALPEYQFSETSEENVWEIASVTIEAGTQFKVADADWGPLNLGGTPDEVTTVTPGADFTLEAGENPGNLSIDVDFTGSVTLTLTGETYTLLLTPAQ